VSRIVLVSFRLGGTDGVSIEAQKWTLALRSLGHEVLLVAGSGKADVIVEGLAIDAVAPPSFDELERVLRDFDLVIVENLASLPLNLGARDVLYRVLEGRRALFHHHDLPWQREHLAHLPGPRDEPDWHHVTINELSRQQLAARGIDAITIMNSFECDPPLGDRETTRQSLGVHDQTLVLLPTRAIARKNVEGALAFAGSLDAILWVLGPVEDGYGPRFDDLLRQSSVDVRRGLDPTLTIHDAYAACDVVVMPSTWEGFGNPVLESVTRRRPLALHPYPVALEILSYGFEFFGIDDALAVRSFLARPDAELLERNLAIARTHFNVAELPGRLRTLLDSIDVK
jgi:glycosyltransferase involved in cell wall biosynthesis